VVGAAALRYSEAKLKKFTQEVYVADLIKMLWILFLTLLKTEKEPEVLQRACSESFIQGAEGMQ
jgi:DNA gyrase subunit A